MGFLSFSDFKGYLQGNMQVIAVRETLLALIGGLTGGLDALFVKEVLNADASVLGMLVSVWSATFLFFVFAGGWIGDYDRKRALLLGTALTLPNPLMVYLARSWHILLFVNILGALGSALATPAQAALIVTSVEQKCRSRAIALISTLTSVVNAIAPPLGALVIQSRGGLEEIRIMFLFQFAFSLGVWLFTAKTLKIQVEKHETKGFQKVVKDVFAKMKNVYHVSKERKATPWLYLSLTGPLAWEIAGPFWTIYAVEVCKSPLFVVGLLATVYSLSSVFLQLPLANLSDAKGRKRIILITRPFLYLCLITLLFGGTFNNWVFVPVIPIFAWALRAIGDSSSPSWTAASTEVIPKDMQSEWEALRTFLWRCTAIPASLASGLLWNIDPRLPFVIALIVDGLLRFPVLIYLIPETLMLHNPSHRALGQNIVIYGLPRAGITSTAQLMQKHIQAEIIDDSILKKTPRDWTHGMLRLPGPRKMKEIEKQIDVVLAQKRQAIIEGKPAVFAAGDQDKATVVLLVASREERALREAKKDGKPDFVALKEVEDEDRKITRLTRQLYGADMSKLPPFDIAFNTDRVPQEKIVKIVSLLHEEEKTES